MSRKQTALEILCAGQRETIKAKLRAAYWMGVDDGLAEMEGKVDHVVVAANDFADKIMDQIVKAVEPGIQLGNPDDDEMFVVGQCRNCLGINRHEPNCEGPKYV